MKSLLTFLFAIVLLLPVISLAEGSPLNLQSREPAFAVNPDVVKDTVKKKPNWFMFPEGFSPRIWGGAVGIGTNIFSAGVDVVFGTAGVLYETTRPDSAQESWRPTEMLMWMSRFRMVYDGRQYGFLVQPNLRYIYDVFMFSFVIGPEIGWETETGFDYGISLRVGGAPSFFLANYEVGYLVNSQKFYLTISLCFSLYVLGAVMSI